MNFNNIRLIASDLDGTLLPEATQTLNPELFPIIKSLKEKGICFVSASGRPYFNQYNLFESARDDIDYIAENGGLYSVNGRTTIMGEIPIPVAQKIICFIEEQEGCKWTATTSGPCFVRGTDKAFCQYVEEVLKYEMVPVDSLDELQGPITKVAVFRQGGLSLHLKKLASAFPEVTFVTSGNEWSDYIPKGIHKGRALKALSESLGILPKEILAFGDQRNDIEMLDFAGTSFAMERCAPGVASHADFQTKNVVATLKELLSSLSQ